jgi:hypothetical protein
VRAFYEKQNEIIDEFVRVASPRKEENTEESDLALRRKVTNTITNSGFLFLMSLISFASLIFHPLCLPAEYCHLRQFDCQYLPVCSSINSSHPIWLSSPSGYYGRFLYGFDIKHGSFNYKLCLFQTESVEIPCR